MTINKCATMVIHFKVFKVPFFRNKKKFYFLFYGQPIPNNRLYPYYFLSFTLLVFLYSLYSFKDSMILWSNNVI